MRAVSAAERVAAAAGPELIERLRHLDAIAARPIVADRGLLAADADATTDYDVLLVGGGLSLLLAPLLARRGLSVAVCDRGRIGVAHREWNGSTAELEALVSSGLLTSGERDELVVARYREGLCRWHGGGVYPVSGVLDVAIDARGLLAMARRKCQEENVTLLDGHALGGAAVARRNVRIELDVEGGARKRLLVRAVVDARGAGSPYATADIVCPTVGGVLSGLIEGSGPREVDAAVGDILVTTEGIEDGHQHIWEGFPGRDKENTVYLFYYARRGSLPPGALLSLYARFFEHLGRYKRGPAKLLRPTFGIIPGWSRLAPRPTAPSPRWVLVGDAAALHSPLTFCGFGSLVRSLSATAARIEQAVSGGGAPLADTPIHTGTGFLSLLLASPSPDPRRKESLNALLDAAFSALHTKGNDFYGRLLRDEMSLGEMLVFLRETAKRKPSVYLDVVRDAPVREVMKWVALVGKGALPRR